MRADGAGTKKLIVAFHFQYANQAAWKCESCRKSGLEAKRGCGLRADGPGRAVVWARRGTFTTECPRSYVSAQSLAWLEEYHAWRLGGRGSVRELPARLVEALAILDNELRAEGNNDQ